MHFPPNTFKIRQYWKPGRHPSHTIITPSPRWGYGGVGKPLRADGSGVADLLAYIFGSPQKGPEIYQKYLIQVKYADGS